MRRIHSVGRFGASCLVSCGAAIVIGAIFTLVSVWAFHERAQIIADRGYRIGSNLAHVLAEQTTRSIQAADLILEGIAERLEVSPAMSDHDRAFEQAMRDKLAGLSYVRAIFVIGPDGFITQDTDHPFTPHRNLADRGYFKAHLDNPALGLHVGPPLRSRSTDTWFVSLSRRVGGADGAFHGVVVAAVEVRRFEAFYTALNLDRMDTIVLLRRDGTLLLRAPHQDVLMERSYAEIPLFRERLKAAPVGSFRGESVFDGAPRFISYRALDRYPIVVGVGIAEETLLAPWWRNTIGAYAVGLVIATALVAFAIAYSRYRRHEEAVRARQLQAQRIEALGRMTGGIAHDFNNLLAVIASGLRVLRRSLGRDQAAADEVVSQIADATDRGVALCAQLLAFARRQDLKVEAIDANGQLARLNQLLRQAAGSNIRLAMEPAPDLWPCYADRVQFDTAILNLVVNARDAMPRGGSIDLRTRNLHNGTAGDYVEVSVTDAGEGMSPEIRQRALEPFFSTKGENGTGLGLSQVYGVMQQVGGDLRIESEVGVGTCVRLLFARATR